MIPWLQIPRDEHDMPNEYPEPGEVAVSSTVDLFVDVVADAHSDVAPAFLSYLVAHLVLVRFLCGQVLRSTTQRHRVYKATSGAARRFLLPWRVGRAGQVRDSVLRGSCSDTMPDHSELARVSHFPDASFRCSPSL